MTGLVALGLLLAADAQEIRIQKPPTRTSLRATNFDPGDASEVDLATLANDIATYDKKHVKTRGRLESVASVETKLREFYVLSAGRAHVLVVPGYGILRDDLEQLVGSEVLARGIVRMLGGVILEEIELPPLPAPAAELPRVSLTLLGLSVSRPRGTEPTGRSQTAELLADPARFAGKLIRIVGQFRGRNLYGDLPEGSQRAAGDWVLKEGDHAVWVTGRAPKGKGFTLDPGYKSDASRWLEVEGKPEVLNGVVYLRASKVALAQRRKQDER